MKIELNKISFCFLLIFFFFSIQSHNLAQNQKLTFSQVYEFKEPRLLIRLPVMKGWLDDENYLQLKKEDDKQFLV